jgi:hypothetical protein
VENSSDNLLRFPPWAGDPGQRHRSTPFHHKSFSHSSATLTCSLGVIGILLHSLVDYNLQIPANAAIFFVFCFVFCSNAAGPPMVTRSHKPNLCPRKNEDFFTASEVV